MKLHLVDGTFELFRAQFSKRPDHRTPAGKPFKATAGVVQSMLWLLEDPGEAVTHVAIAFDNPIRSFRNDLYAGYKSDEGVLPELRAQFDDVEAALRALGVAVWSMNRWEADDALATAAVRFADEVEQVRILTPDKDLGQVLRGDRIVQVDRIRDKVITEATVREARGVGPESIPDLLALIGDTADGIPGVPGWGDKSAAAILGRWIHLEAIPADPAAWEVPIRGADRLAASLAAHRDEAALWKRLAIAVTDVPLPETLDQLRWRGAPRAEFTAWCGANGLDKLIERVKQWEEP
jgi:5'-3' exonuclease